MDSSRNILIIGKTGSGKRSISNAIANTTLFEVGGFMKTVSQPPDNLFGEYNNGEKHFRFMHVTISSTQDDKTLEKNVANALNYFQSLNLVLLVFKLEPIDTQLCKKVQTAVSFLEREALSNTAVLVTFCDLLSSRAKEVAQQELQESIPVLRLAKKGTHMICLPQISCVQASLINFFRKSNDENGRLLQNLCNKDEMEVSTLPPTIPGIYKNQGAVSAQPNSASTKSRKILIFGKTGVGKRTIANAILGFNRLPIGTSIESATRQAGRVDFDEFVLPDGTSHKFAIVDTVSVTDTRSSKSHIIERANSAIKKLKSVNLILFVTKLERFTHQERDSFQEVISLLQHSAYTSTVTAYIVTGCEQKSEADREAGKADIIAFAGNVTSFAKKGTHFVGLPALDQLPAPLRSHYEQIRQLDEIKLKKLVKESLVDIPIRPVENTHQQPPRILGVALF